MEDQAAISRMKQGDPGGLEALVRRYQVKAVHAAYLVLQNRSLSEEVVQNAYLKAFEKIHQFEDARPFAPWFFKIVVNEALKTARKQGRLYSLQDEPDDGAHALARWMIDAQPLPEEQIEIKESGQTVRNALRQLSPEQLATIVMRYYLEMSDAEMAARLERPLSTVKWWLRVARKRLGALMKTSIE